jgi:hypothetical protein
VRGIHPPPNNLLIDVKKITRFTHTHKISYTTTPVWCREELGGEKNMVEEELPKELGICNDYILDH